MKIPKKTLLNQRTFYNLRQHSTFGHTKMCLLIRQRICESLVEIQQFRHDCSSIMFENTQKNTIKSKGLL